MLTSDYGEKISYKGLERFVNNILEKTHKEHLKFEQIPNPEEQDNMVKVLNTQSFEPFLADKSSYKATLFLAGKTKENRKIISAFNEAAEMFLEEKPNTEGNKKHLIQLLTLLFREIWFYIIYFEYLNSFRRLPIF